MGKLVLTLVALTLCANQMDAARMVEKRVSVHHQSGVVSLTQQQQKFRKASQNAEANMVCRKPEIKETINADSSVDGVTDINWDTVKATAADGMKKIEKSISTLSTEIEELEQRIRELEEAGRWGELGASEITEMLDAACVPFAEFSGTEDKTCSAAYAETECGWNSPACNDDFLDPPWDAPIEAFAAAAASKITGHRKLSVVTFRKQCAEVFPDGACSDFCDEFAGKVTEANSKDSAEVLGNTDTLDEVKAKKKTRVQELADAQAEKEACSQAQTQLDAFRAQLGKLSDNHSASKSAVGRYKRTLRMRQMKLRRKLQELEKLRRVLEEATAKVVKSLKAVEEMEAVIKDLEEKLKKQMELIAEIQAKIADIETATEVGRLFKLELSRTLSNAVDTLAQAIHKPLEHLKIMPEANIAKKFDDAEEGAAPAMKQTVRAVASFCKQAEDDLTNPLVNLGTSNKLNFICTGQDWDNMIAEAQASVKGASKQVVDLLLAEQSGVVSDNHIPVSQSMTLRVAEGEPKGLRHAVAGYGGKGGTFVDGYVNPGWAVDENNGEVGTVGKMLMLYQKLGEAAELMNQKWAEAEAGARALEEDIRDALVELEKLQEVLKQAIARKEIAQDNVNKVEEIVQTMEAEVKTNQKDITEGQAAADAVKDELLKEHRERAAALLEVLQEMKQRPNGAQ